MLDVAQSHAGCKMLPRRVLQTGSNSNGDAIVRHWVCKLPKYDASLRCTDLVLLAQLCGMSIWCGA